jgi:hypothetical protein
VLREDAAQADSVFAFDRTTSQRIVKRAAAAATWRWMAAALDLAYCNARPEITR